MLDKMNVLELVEIDKSFEKFGIKINCINAYFSKFSPDETPSSKINFLMKEFNLASPEYPDYPEYLDDKELMGATKTIIVITIGFKEISDEFKLDDSHFLFDIDIFESNGTKMTLPQSFDADNIENNDPEYPDYVYIHSALTYTDTNIVPTKIAIIPKQYA